MSKSIKIALLTMGFFIGLAGASFFGAKYFPQPQAVPVQAVALPPQAIKLQVPDIAHAKTIHDLPPGTLPGEQDELFPIAKTPSGSVVMIDATSVRLVDGKATFLVTIVEPEGTISEEGDHILGVVLKQVIDCKLHQASTAYSVLISEDGRVLSSKTDIPGSHPITPGSKGAEVEKLICTAPDGTPRQAPKRLLKGEESV